MQIKSNKQIILIGGNSAIIQDILEDSKFFENYDEVFILCHRSYSGINKNYKVIENINPSLISKTIEGIIRSKSIRSKCDIICASTPTKNSYYKDFKEIEWGIVSIKIMCLLSSSKEVRRIIILGSSLALVPLLRSGIYKSIKILELYCYDSLSLNRSDKVCLFILPPIGKNITGIGKFFSQSRLVWVKKIQSEIKTNNKLIVPFGINGILVKILLFFKGINT